MLAAAANASSVDISDLAAAMKMSGAVFASNKQPMDDMVTALAMLGNAGLKGSDAGTSLKTMMLSLAAPTAKAKGVLADMGVAVYDASGNMRSFETIIADLSVATAGMTDAQRNAALSTVFGSDAIRAATILTRDYSTSWDGIAGALNNGTAASDVANARMKGVGGAIEYLKGSIDSFLIGAALPYMAVIGEIIRSGADMITAFGALPKPVMDAAVAFGAVLAAAGPVMLAITGLTAALGFLLSPIGLVVVGVGALAAAWATNFGGIRDLTAEIAGQVGVLQRLAGRRIEQQRRRPFFTFPPQKKVTRKRHPGQRHRAAPRDFQGHHRQQDRQTMPLVEHVVQKARLRIVVVPRIAAKAVFTQQLDKLLRPLTVRRCGRKLCRQPRCQQVELTQVMRNVEIGILRLRNQKRRLPEIQLRFRPTTGP
jgi:hypothetical protein